MSVVEFKELDKLQRPELVFCIIDRTEYCATEGIKGIIKNISDWTLQNITIQGYTVLVSKDEDELLRYASDLGYNHAVVFSTGTEFINGYQCFEEFKSLIQEEFFLAGHVLDREDGYFELHHQCYVINLNIYKELNYPFVGQQKLNTSHIQDAPIRSIENYHDSHTPLWVSKGNVKTTYRHQAHGWNILSVAFDHNQIVKVFGPNIRQNKKHYYPDYIESFRNEINYVYKREAFCSGIAVYPFNSETIENLDISNVQQLVVPAAGLNWIHCVNKYCADDVVIKFYDYSLPTLNFVKCLFEEWDGTDYVGFVRSYFEKTFGFLQNKEIISLCGPQDLEKEWNDIKDYCNWDKLKKLKVEFHWVNILDTTDNLHWIDKDKVTLINLSNIFNYIGTAATYSIEDRTYAEQEFLKKVPNAHIMIRRKANAGLGNQLPTWKIV